MKKMDHVKKTTILGIPPRQILIGGVSMAFALLAVLSWQYFAALQNDIDAFWDGQFFNYITLVPAIGAALAGSAVTGQFVRGERPHRIWVAFSLGLWFWVAGEISVILFDFFPAGIVSPDFQLVDIFWLLGYFSLGLSLVLQLLSAYGMGQRRGLSIYAGMVVFAIILAALLTEIVRKGKPDDSWSFLFVTILYPVLDVLAGGTAIWLSLLFGRGRWSRPWWGLILFAITDAIDAFYWSGGYDLVSVAAQNTLDFISLVTYPASYMTAGLALLANYFILRYGMESGLLKPARESGLAKRGME
jgi:hypothetical protein